MARDTTVRSAVATLAIGALLLGPCGIAAAEEAPPEGDRIVPPSEYVDDIETPGRKGGTDDEVDAAAAQAASGGEEESSTASSGERAAAIATDLLVGRPTALLATVAGSAIFALSLPITASTGQYDEALERFVEEPVGRLSGPLGE